MIWILLMLPVTLTTSSKIKAGRRAAGVNQLSYFDDSHQPQYAFNASEAREVCSSLGLLVASKAQMQSALKQGLETCRFGWIDEHFAVIPRIQPSHSCGGYKTGLVEWRTSVRKKFDVFCFNESDVVTQLEDTTTDSPFTPEGHDPSPSQDATLTSDLLPSKHPVLPSSPSLFSILSAGRPISSFMLLQSSQGRMEAEPQPAQFLSSTQGSFWVPTKTLLIALTCGLLLVITAGFGYAKLDRNSFVNWDVKQQEDYIETEEWTCVMYTNEAIIDRQVTDVKVTEE